MKRSSLFIALVAWCGAASATGNDTTLTPYGLGPVKIGMTVREAERALGAKLVQEDWGDCAFAQRADGKNPNVYYQLYLDQQSGDRIAYIEVFKDLRDQSRVVFTTALGIQVGSTEREVKKAYGAKLSVRLSDPAFHQLILDAPDHKHVLAFQMINGKVEQLRAGEHPSVDYWDGCT